MPGMSEEAFDETLDFWRRMRDHAGTAAFYSLGENSNARGGAGDIPLAPRGQAHRNNYKLSFQFPDGMKYGAIARQFELHSCGSTERRFVIVLYEGKVPGMASCAKCQRKFFTPARTFKHDPIGAEQYLANKFDLHRCEAPRNEAFRSTLP
jgi:hypothetical protein